MAITVKKLVDEASKFNLNWFEMDKKQQRDLRKYLKESESDSHPQPQQEPEPEQEEQEQEPEEPAQPPKATWRSYIRLASTELKSPDSELRATLANIQKRAKELAINDGYVFKNARK
jgi:CO dehydrogenase/acetyl-CoA synthase beta subunit